MSDIENHNHILDNQAPVNHVPAPNIDNATQNLESVYDRKKIELLFKLYMVSLLSQYIGIFFSVPFDAIDDRPLIVVLSSFYTLALVCCHLT